jgi:hypothetical protein
MHVGKITHHDLENYEEFMKSDVFNEVEELARRMDLLIRYGNAS